MSPVENVPIYRDVEPTESCLTGQGVTVVLPKGGKGWRFRYVDDFNQRREVSGGKVWPKAYDKLSDLEARLKAGAGDGPTRDATVWIDWWLSDGRQPRSAKGTEKKPWGKSNRDNNTRLMNLWVRPKVKRLRCEEITTPILQQCIDGAVKGSTPDEAARLLACIRQAVREGYQHSYFTKTMDELCSKLSAPVVHKTRAQGQSALAVSMAEVPTADAVEEAAAATVFMPRARWWYELMVQLAAVSGMRLGELLDLDTTDVNGRILTVDTQVLEHQRGVECSLPKGDKTRTTVARAVGPGGYDVSAALARRVAEALNEPAFECCTTHGPRHLLFPAPHGGWWRQSNWRNRAWTPARDAAGWERGGSVLRADDGTVTRDGFVWGWHSLRHHAATEWIKLGAPLIEVATALGHADSHITAQLYVGSQATTIADLAARA